MVVKGNLSRGEVRGEMGVALFEALDGLIEPGRARRMVQAALDAAGLQAVPEDVGTFRALVEGAMRSEIVRRLGADAADTVADQLAPLMEMAESDVRIRLPSQPALPAGVAPLRIQQTAGDQTRPVVPVVSLDETLVAQLRHALGASADVRHVTMTMDLVATLDRGHRVPLLVLDHGRSPVEPATIAWITSLLPERPTVFLWQATDSDLARLNTQVPPTRSWYAVAGNNERSLLRQVAAVLARSAV